MYIFLVFNKKKKKISRYFLIKKKIDKKSCDYILFNQININYKTPLAL